VARFAHSQTEDLMCLHEKTYLILAIMDATIVYLLVVVNCFVRNVFEVLLLHTCHVV
jgi:hypothetical protein